MLKTIYYPSKTRLITFIVILLSVVVAGWYSYILLKPAQAAPVVGFVAGKIIDDSVFTNKSTMSVVQIQNFLNSKVPTCDTAGAQISEYGGPDLNGDGKVQRWEWGQANYNQSTFVCLRDYVDGGKSSAQIIFDAAQEFSINPQVLIVLLQKEQGLIQDTWPLNVQYRSATGYGCPDTAACDSQYYGLTNQIRWAARMFRAIMNASPTWYTPYIVGTNYIQYNPNSSCGGSNVNIENRATQALYNYTPYQPSQAVLDAGWGTVNCGAYGNRNFYLYFTEWFGNTLLANLPGCNEATNTSLACVWRLYSPTGKQYLTSSNQFRDNLYLQSNYRYTGKSFFGNVIPMPGNVPIYRLTKLGGEVFLTADKTEYDTLSGSSFTGHGIDFYANPGDSNSGFPVYRLYSQNEEKHIWTSDPIEYSQYIGYGFKYEGVAFTSISPINQETPPPAGKQLVYRFYIPQSYSHFWTTELAERNRMITAGYNYEGVAWHSSINKTDRPVYRLYSLIVNKHLYTTDSNERSQLVSTGAWRDEGVSQYVSNTANTSPAYRLYSSVTKSHVLTTSSSERSQLLANGIWRDEGVAWYQP